MERTQRIPSYRRHKASGQAVVTIEGRDHYLGAFDSPASHEAYARTLAAWRAGTLQATRRSPGAEPVLSVAALVARYLEHVKANQLYTKAGKPTSEHACLAIALRPLVQLCGSMPAAEFGPLNLVTVRKALCVPMAPPQPGERGRRVHGPIVRHSVNRHVDRIRRVYRWATTMQLVPAGVWQALRALEGLRKGAPDARESDPVRPAEPRAIAAVLRRVAPTIAACVRLQWLSGARPGEIVRVRLRDIDRKGAVWIYRPGRHKTEHRGKDREIMFGPKAQRVLAQHLRADPTAFLFPNSRDTGPMDEGSYRKAVRTACLEAGVEPWKPNQLRHSAGTRFRRALGIEASRTALGHSDAGTTLIYAERDRQSAIDVALRLG